MITLEEGQKAPAFTGHDQEGNRIALGDYKGKKLVLYFYSEAGSPTCTIESCNLRDHYNELTKKGYDVIGVSPDQPAALKKFELKYKLPFTLITDTENKISNLFGVWDKKKLFGREYMGILRTTFVIDEKSIIRKIFRKPKNKVHAEEILSLFF